MQHTFSHVQKSEGKRMAINKFLIPKRYKMWPHSTPTYVNEKVLIRTMTANQRLDHTANSCHFDLVSQPTPHLSSRTVLTQFPLLSHYATNEFLKISVPIWLLF